MIMRDNQQLNRGYTYGYINYMASWGNMNQQLITVLFKSTFLSMAACETVGGFNALTGKMSARKIGSNHSPTWIAWVKACYPLRLQDIPICGMS